MIFMSVMLKDVEQCDVPRWLQNKVPELNLYHSSVVMVNTEWNY